MPRLLSLAIVLTVCLRGDAPPVGGLLFVPAPGWAQTRSGREPATATVANVSLQDEAGGMPQRTLRRLPPDGVVITATLFPPGPWSAGFRKRTLPLSLSDADVRHGWEGQPASNVPEYVLWQQVNGSLLDVRVYFSTQHPSKDLATRAQAELARLTVP